MKIRKLSRLVALAPLALACSAQTVDLDAPLIKASNEPGVLGIVDERVEKLAVDAERLYWSGRNPNGHGDNIWFLHSCQKRACAATLVTYDAQTYGTENIFSVSGQNIYWYRALTAELVTCPVAGCDGAPRSLASVLGFTASAFDDAGFYFSDSDTLYRVPLSQPDPHQPLGASVGPVRKVVIRGDFAYWLVVENRAALLRTYKQGGAPVETLSEDVRYSYNHEFGVTTDETSIYWTNNVLSGSINRCPLTGCTGAPDVVIAPLRAPQNLLIDGSRLYYQHEIAASKFALSSCVLPACAASEPLLEQLAAPGVLAVDEDYLYAATTEQDVGPSNYSEEIVARIRRLPKPEQPLP